MLHKSTANQQNRIQKAFMGGQVRIVSKEPKLDKFGTPIPNQVVETEIGRYPFRKTAIHSNDIYQFGTNDTKLDLQIRIPLIEGIYTDMTATIGDKFYNIVKTFPDYIEQELELLLAEELTYQ